jgi:hypothetical protein
LSEHPLLPTEEDLDQLPLRAIVAYAVRCAKRVQPRFRLAKSIPDYSTHQAAVAKAVKLAEAFCVRDDVDAAAAADAADTAAYDAADAQIKAAADAAACAAAACEAANPADDAAPAYDAACAAGYAASACGEHAEAFAEAAAGDYERLLELDYDGWSDFGPPVDPSEKGPLGPLWPRGAPRW